MPSTRQAIAGALTSERSRRGFRLLTLGVASILTSFTALADEVAYDETSTAVVVRLTESYGEFAGQSSYVLYGDGRIVTHHPLGRSTRSTPRKPMSAEKMRSMLERLATNGVADFDSKQVRARMRGPNGTLDRSRPLFAASDSSSIEIHLSYQVLDDEGKARPIERTLRWQGLRHDARRHPEIPELQSLEALRRELMNPAADGPGGESP